ncbi:MAG: DUF1631 domain-containing protein [Gammaproteobacteria bacterium]|nr:DUF1631 domain-containing protein [Gammaproteobacteria bacterium]
MLSEQFRAAVTSCRGVVTSQLPTLVSEMFESLDDTLYELADKAESNIRQNAFFDAMREIRKNRERIEVGTIQGLLKEYDEFWRSGHLQQASAQSSALQQHEEDLSLLDKDDLEEGLAVNNMVTRGESRHAQQLYGLNQRFGYMQGGGELESRSNPLSPRVICQAFHDCFQTVSIDVPTRLVVYKQFQIAVIDALNGLYEQVNRQLVEAGVLPKLTRRVQRAAHHSASSAPASPPPLHQESGRGSVVDDEDRLQEELFSTLKQLLNQRRAEAPVARSAVRVPVISSGDMVRALSLMQQGAMQEMDSQVQTTLPESLDVRANLLQVMGVGQNGTADRKLSGNDEDAIDVIAMLFEFILEDRNLPDAMKALLSRLQIPMLKVAILDRTFFHSKGHPARRLLNSMAKSAIGWSEQAGKSDGGLYAKMSSIVDRVLDDFDNDLTIFSRLLEEFTAYIESEERGSRITEQRATQVTQGKEQLNSARHRVFEEINNRLFGNDWIPAPVVTLIKDGWRDVLQLIYLRQGEQSPEWQGALELMDQLLRSVEPLPDAERRQALLNEIPPLLKGLRSGLKEIAYDQHKMARIFKDLQECHIRCLKGEEAAALAAAQPRDDSKTDQSAAAESAPPPASADEPTQRIDDEFQAMAERLAVGSWLEIQDAKGMTFRAKLSWRSMVSGTCLFVNRKGMKVMEIPLVNFAAWLRSGKAVALGGGNEPLMDRALHSMLDVLKRTEATE